MNQNKEFDTLIVSGGGFNGLQFLGIIKYLEEINLLIKINKFIGVSMGAFINLLVIIGYKFKDIENFITKFDFSKIFDLKFEKIITEDNIKGLTNGENFDKLIKKFLNNKELKENITFKELYEITKKNYIIIVTNLTQDKIEIINHENYPNLPIYIGLRMTSCIPIFFEPIEYNNNFYIDGVMKDNFPIQILNDDEISKTLGIVLQLEQSEYDVKNMTTYSYLLHLYRVLTNEPIRNKIKKYKELCKLFIINPKINSFNFQIKNEERIELINYGYELCKSLI
jgi:NTE family protein